jgi:hypothetical protein
MSINLVDTKVGMSHKTETYGGTGSRQLFHGDNMVQIAHLAASELFGNCDPQQPQLSKIFPYFLEIKK